MITIHIAGRNDREDLMRLRLEMLRTVNGLSPDVQFDPAFLENTRRYFLEGDQTTVLATVDDGDGGRAVGCATVCYGRIIPAYRHPDGRLGHVMNVFVSAEYRRLGIARSMMERLIADAREKGCTKITLDATESGRPLYASLGFVDNDRGMILVLP
jgi:GNAT superfamily N-acetyltransferase